MRRPAISGGVVAGGDAQRAVELPGGAGCLGAGVAGDLDRHVHEAVVDGRVATGQVRPHLATEIGPGDGVVGGDFDGGVGGGLAHDASSRVAGRQRRSGPRVSMVLAAVRPGCSRGPGPYAARRKRHPP